MTPSANWSARNGHTSVVLPDGSILLMGGYDDSRRNDIWRSVDQGATWTEVTDSAEWSARSGHASVVLPDGSILVMGGSDPGRMNDVWRSVDQGATWIEVTNSAPWTARQPFQASVVLPDGSIALMGGFAGTLRNDVWRSVDQGATWNELTDSAEWTERSFHTSVVLPDGSVVLMGGKDGSLKNDVWRMETASSYNQNPTHTYTEAGTYDVALQSYNSDGFGSIQKPEYITVSPQPQTFTIAEGGTYNGVVSNGDAPFTLADSPSYGTLTFNPDGNFTYSAVRQPTVGFQGTDTFEYKSNDQDESDDPYVVSITITPVNDAPAAQANSFTVGLGDTHSGNVTATDVDGDALNYTLQTGPDNGTLAFNRDGSFAYTADAYGDGTDSFTFVANDGLAISDPATVSITITGEELFCGGSGTVAEPYLICTAEQLDNIREDLTAHYKLDNDVDLEAYLADGGAGYNDGKGWEPIGAYIDRDDPSNAPFTGSLDGNDKTITNLYMNYSGPVER